MGRTEEERQKQRALKTASNCCNRLSFQSEEVEKDCVRQIVLEGRSSKGAIGRCCSPFPKEMVQQEAEGGSEVEWEIRAGVPTAL